MTLEGWERLLTPTNLAFLGRGLFVTVGLTVIVCLLGFVLAIPLGTLRAEVRGVARWPSTVLVDAIRNTPVLVTIFTIRYGLPAIGIRVDSFTTAIVALTIYEAVCLGELVRGGIQSVPRGQRDAAIATGLSGPQTYFLVVLPQALRTMLPALVGEFIVTLQGSSLVSAISVLELTGSAVILLNIHGNPMETMALVGLIYVALSTVLSMARSRLERRYGAAFRSTDLVAQ